MRPRLPSPVVGTPPTVSIGDRVWCRTVGDQWVLRLVSGLPQQNGERPPVPVVPTVLDRHPLFGSGERMHEDWPLADIRPDNGTVADA